MVGRRAPQLPNLEEGTTQLGGTKDYNAMPRGVRTYIAKPSTVTVTEKTQQLRDYSSCTGGISGPSVAHKEPLKT